MEYSDSTLLIRSQSHRKKKKKTPIKRHCPSRSSTADCANIYTVSAPSSNEKYLQPRCLLVSMRGSCCLECLQICLRELDITLTPVLDI